MCVQTASPTARLFFERYTYDMEPITWTAYEHPRHERSREWFISFGMAVFALVCLAVILGNYLFAAVILLGGGVLVLLLARPHERISFEITGKHLAIGHEIYPYSEMKSFWFMEEEDEVYLLIDTPRITAPDLIVPIPAEDRDVIRALLLENKVKESPLEISFARNMLDFFGF